MECIKAFMMMVMMMMMMLMVMLMMMNNSTGTGLQGAKDNDYSMAIYIKT